MSNHFPTVPSTFNITSVEYGVLWNPSVDEEGYWPGVGSGLTVTGTYISGNIFYNRDNGLADAAPLDLTVGFTTPGSAGSFDQDTFESDLVTMVNNYAANLATLNGLSTATAQSYFQINRNWTFQDSASTWTLTHSDTVTYPA